MDDLQLNCSLLCKKKFQGYAFTLHHDISELYDVPVMLTKGQMLRELPCFRGSVSQTDANLL